MTMANSVKAKLLDKRELVSHNVRLYKFEYLYFNDGKQPNNRTFDVIFADDDFEITVWTINITFGKQKDDIYLCFWHSIKQTQKTNKKFYGNCTFLKQYDPDRFTNLVDFSFDASDLKMPALSFFDTLKAYSSYLLRVYIYLEHQTHLTEAYEKLLLKENLLDVTFIVGGEKIPANKCTLALHSEVFESMFETDMIEKKTSEVEITDIEPEIFKFLIRYIYCGKVGTSDINDLLKLSLAADKYSLETLVSLCCHRLNDKVRQFDSSPVVKDAVIDILIVSDQVRQDFLKKICIKYVIRFKDDVVKTKGYEDMIKTKRVDLLSEIFTQLKCVEES